MPDPAADGLIHVAYYRWVTGDQTTPSANVEQALDDAYDLVLTECRRPSFAYDTRTETLDISPRGFVYPAVTPVAEVSDPADASVRYGGVFLGAFWPTDFFTALPAQRTITYAGGYHPVWSGTAPELPTKLARVICRVAFLILHPQSIIGAGVPAGAKSASVGDVSVSGDLSGFVAIDPSIARDLRGFKRRRAAQPFVRS
jgi:hypothetical protein